MELIECGKIVNTHGIKGEVKITPYADSPKEVATQKTLYLGKDKTEYKVVFGRVHGECVIAKLQGVEDMNAAMLLKNMTVYMVKDYSTLKPGQHFIVDLMGLTVIDNETGEEYGTIVDFYDGNANNAYEIKLKSGKTVLFPDIKQVVKAIDIDKKIMKITPLAGMFDI